jgi:hypothetical protein
VIKYKFHATDAEREEEQQFSNVRILDLKTLTSVLTGENYTFPSACEIFGAPASRTRKSRPRVTKPAIERLLRNAPGELELLNRLKWPPGACSGTLLGSRLALGTPAGPLRLWDSCVKG